MLPLLESEAFGSEDLMASILDLCRELIPADGYAIWCKEPSTGRWSILMKAGISDKYAEAAVERVNRIAKHSPAAQSAESQLLLQKTLRVEDVAEASWSSQTADLYEEEGIRSLLVVPLETEPQPLGTMTFYFRSPRRFRETDDHLALVLASLASKAIGSTQLHEEDLRFWRRELAESHRAGFLAEISMVFAASLDYRKNLQDMANLCVPYFADWCVVDMIGDRGVELAAIGHLDAARVEQAREIRKRFPPDLAGSDVMALNYKAGQPLLVRSLRPEMIDGLPDTELRTFLIALSLRSALIVPIRIRETTVGTMTFLQSESERNFQKSDLYLAEELSRRAAFAIDNARLYQKTQETAEARDELLRKLQKQIKQQAALTSVSRNGLSQTTLVSLFEDTVFWLTHALDIERCFILETPAETALEVCVAAGWESEELAGWFENEAVRQVLGKVPTTTPLLLERAQPEFQQVPLFVDADVSSAALAQVRPPGGVFGVIGVFSRQASVFSQDDIQFLQSIANIIAAAVDRRQTELALAESERKYRQLFDLSPSGILLADASFRVTSANPAAGNIFGSPEALAGADLRALLLPRQEVKMPLRDLEVALKRRNGEDFVAEVSLDRISEQPGEWVFGIVRDITQRKELERMKNEFIATVSHELRTPLTSIFVSLDLLAAEKVPLASSKAVSLLDVAYKNCQRLIDLINDVLDLQKSESGKAVRELRPMDLIPLLVQAFQMNQSYAQQYGVRFDTDFHCQEAWAAVDPDRFLQVLANLLSNAAKFSLQGSVVTIGTACGESDVRVSVTNEGLSIPEEYHSKLFEKFVQVGSSLQRNRPGSGLGLAISKSLIQEMGGRIDFRSGEGTTEFFFDLPRLQPGGLHVEPDARS